MEKTRVVVVDDSALVRSLLTEIINRQPDMVCVGAAADPLVAREMIRETNPDVITLDVEMPRMDGIDFLSKLMRLRPMPVVMVSSLTERGSEITMRALELGAVDFVQKPTALATDRLLEISDELIEKVKAAARAEASLKQEPGFVRVFFRPRLPAVSASSRRVGRAGRPRYEKRVRCRPV